jgi:hypothetical protein
MDVKEILLTIWTGIKGVSRGELAALAAAVACVLAKPWIVIVSVVIVIGLIAYDRGLKCRRQKQ